MEAQDARTIGARARMVRRRRGLSLDVVAGLAGITKTYLSMLELGQRGFNRRGLLEDLADALACSVADLTGQPYLLTPDRATADALACLPSISLALHDCTLKDVPDVPARPVAELARMAAQANVHCDQARYQLAGRDLGTVLTELQVHAVAGDLDTRRTALVALVEACRVAFGVTKNLGHPEVAAHAARRGWDAARQHGDADLIGFASWYRTVALMRVGARHRASMTLASAIAELEPQIDPGAQSTLATESYGLLHLTSALHAGRAGNAGAAADHLAEARRIADRTGERNTLLSHFGPANVTAWNLNVAVELGNGPSAAERLHASGPVLDALGSAERRAALHMDLARGWAQAEGAHDAEAIRHLDAADRIAPTRIRNDPIARDLVVTLVRRATRRVWELDSLRNRFGIGGQGPRKVDS
ncbi:MAG: helix-turn-helix domain-containing protein [Pseudonocardiaceae bacterium]